jgi:hypothetical protein
MARPHVVTALERKYAHLLGCQKRLRYPSLSLTADLAHIEAVMRLFDPSWDKAGVRPIIPYTPSRWRKKGLGMRTTIEILKRADTPLTTREIATQVLERLSLPKPDRWEFNSLCASFHTSLSHQIDKGLVMVEGKPKRWLLKPLAANSPSTGG